MQTLTREQKLHEPGCGERFHTVCRFDACECLCHEPELWADKLDMREWEEYYFSHLDVIYPDVYGSVDLEGDDDYGDAF